MADEDTAMGEPRRRIRGLVLRAGRRAVDVVEDLIDRRYGLDTSRVVDLEELGIAHPERVPYQPSRWFALRAALGRGDVTRDDVLVDLGCGKGRIVFQAAMDYPFKRVIGVELSPELTAIARANIERNRGHLCCQDIEIVSSDVLEWTIPDDLTMVYLFNPFRGEIFAQTIARLVAWVDGHQRPLRLIYSNPREHERLMATGHVRELPVHRGLLSRLREGDAIRTYEIVPTSP